MNTDTPPLPAPTPEQRLEAAYATSSPPALQTPPDHELTAEEKLANGHAANKPTDDTEEAPPNAEDAEQAPTRYVVDDPEVQTALSDVARELKLDDAAVQQLVDKVSPALDARTVRNVRAMVDGWEADTKSDPEIGGANLNEAVGYAKKALALGTPELRQLLGPVNKGGTGLGNHAEIIRWAAAVGRRLAAAERAASLPPKSGDEKLATTYAREPAPRRRGEPAGEPARAFTSPTRRMPKTAEEKLAAGYRAR